MNRSKPSVLLQIVMVFRSATSLTNGLMVDVRLLVHPCTHVHTQLVHPTVEGDQSFSSCVLKSVHSTTDLGSFNNICECLDALDLRDELT